MKSHVFTLDFFFLNNFGIFCVYFKQNGRISLLLPLFCQINAKMRTMNYSLAIAEQIVVSFFFCQLKTLKNQLRNEYVPITFFEVFNKNK